MDVCGGFTKDMYFPAMTFVRTPVGDTQYFSLEVGFHQELVLSPLFFTLNLDMMTKGINPVVYAFLLMTQ